MEASAVVNMVNIDEGIIIGLDGCADWVARASSGDTPIELRSEMASRIVEHLQLHLQFSVAQGHPRRQVWLDALAQAQQWTA
jgi:hypothetical protein